MKVNNMGFDFIKYNKIILVGNSGSGKSWTSKRIAEITGYPLFHLDKEHWRPNMVMAPRAERVARQQEIVSGEKWIIDGNFDSTMEIRFAAADLIIFFDLNRLVCISGVIKRNKIKRTDMPDYWEEPKLFGKEFFDFCKWIWNYRKNDGKSVMELHKKYPGKEFLHIKSRREVKRLLER